MAVKGQGRAACSLFLGGFVRNGDALGPRLACIADIVSEVLQRSRNAIVAQLPILVSHPYNQVGALSVDSRSSRVGSALGAVRLLATSLRYQPKIVSGFATNATCSSA